MGTRFKIFIGAAVIGAVLTAGVTQSLGAGPSVWQVINDMRHSINTLRDRSVRLNYINHGHGCKAGGLRLVQGDPRVFYVCNGVDGTNGTNGTDGTNGIDGERGPQGPQGDTGATGAQGDPGAAGPQGPAGADGTDGTDGTDGLGNGTIQVCVSEGGSLQMDDNGQPCDNAGHDPITLVVTN